MNTQNAYKLLCLNWKMKIRNKAFKKQQHPLPADFWSGSGLSWKIYKFHGMHKNCLSMAVFSSNLLHGTKFGDPILNGFWVIKRTSKWLAHRLTQTQTLAMAIPNVQNGPRVKMEFSDEISWQLCCVNCHSLPPESMGWLKNQWTFCTGGCYTVRTPTGAYYHEQYISYGNTGAYQGLSGIMWLMPPWQEEIYHDHSSLSPLSIITMTIC